MGRPYLKAGGIVFLSLVVGSFATESLVNAAPDTDTEQYAQTIGFSFTTPMGLVVLAYVMKGFDFTGYFTDRSTAAIVGDYVLAIMAAGAVGLVTTAIASQLTSSGMLLYLNAGLFTFGGAFVVFILRTGDYSGLDDD